ncbi:MAG: hypothetical protein HUU50_20645 [Candidatus Brocadiae bacterium]|nr:hypothetical protein [Candidatus Brocadiia bacterium]
MFSKFKKNKEDDSTTALIDLVFLTLFGILALNPNFQKEIQASSKDNQQALQPYQDSSKNGTLNRHLELEKPQILYLYISPGTKEVWIKNGSQALPISQVETLEIGPHVQLVFGDMPSRSLVACLQRLRQSHSIETIDFRWQEESFRPTSQ